MTRATDHADFGATPGADSRTGGAAQAPLVHIGYPKTGTTLLQKRLFAQHSNVWNLGRPEAAYESDHDGLRSALMRADADTFEAWLRERPDALGRTTTEAAHRVPILSDEHMATGYHTPPFATLPPARILDRLRRVAPDAHVLIVLRNQPAMLMAIHMNLLRMGRTRDDPDRWLAATREAAEPNVLSAFAYDGLVMHAQHVFGASRVHLAFYEDLEQDRARFVADIARATGLAADTIHAVLDTSGENVTSSAELAYLALRRRLPANMLGSRPMRALRPLINLGRIRRLGRRLPVRRARGRRFSAANMAFLNAFYANSNARLAMLAERDLGALGYAGHGPAPEQAPGMSMEEAGTA